mmetsp:Transcript_59911/g.135529  ORF Transcript_59911/g.135529 Transcript_59911/m.135529 type:complete len:241 (-) Transcript_59911:317-1039(-)
MARATGGAGALAFGALFGRGAASRFGRRGRGRCGRWDGGAQYAGRRWARRGGVGGAATLVGPGQPGPAARVARLCGGARLLVWPMGRALPRRGKRHLRRQPPPEKGSGGRRSGLRWAAATRRDEPRPGWERAAPATRRERRWKRGGQSGGVRARAGRGRGGKGSVRGKRRRRRGLHAVEHFVLLFRRLDSRLVHGTPPARRRSQMHPCERARGGAAHGFAARTPRHCRRETTRPGGTGAG